MTAKWILLICVFLTLPTAAALPEDPDVTIIGQQHEDANPCLVPYILVATEKPTQTPAVTSHLSVVGAITVVNLQGTGYMFGGHVYTFRCVDKVIDPSDDEEPGSPPEEDGSAGTADSKPEITSLLP